MKLPQKLRQPARSQIGLAASFVFLLSACGGGGISAATWTVTYCNSGANLRDDLSSANRSLTSLITNPDLGSPEEVKRSAITSADTYVSQGEEALNNVKGLSEPDVDQGAEIKAAATAKYEKYTTELNSLKTQINALPTDDVDAFSTGLLSYSQKVAAVSKEIANSLSELQEFKGYDKIKEASEANDGSNTAATCKRLTEVAPQ